MNFIIINNWTFAIEIALNWLRESFRHRPKSNHTSRNLKKSILFSCQISTRFGSLMHRSVPYIIIIIIIIYLPTLELFFSSVVFLSLLYVCLVCFMGSCLIQINDWLIDWLNFVYGSLLLKSQLSLVIFYVLFNSCTYMICLSVAVNAALYFMCFRV